VVLFILSENVNSPHSYATDCIKARTPMLMKESHYIKTLVYDSTDADLLIDRYDTMRRYKIKSPKIETEVDKIGSDYFKSLMEKAEEPTGTLYHGTSRVFINFYSSGVLINPYTIPLLNTAILLTSGFVLTTSHGYLRLEYFKASFRTLNFTILLGLIFICLQGHEYSYSGYSMNDGIYGSIFYMLTGFHGFHVIIGTIFLIVCSFRLRASHFTGGNHFAFEAAA
jgi:hypothetical protein